MRQIIIGPDTKVLRVGGKPPRATAWLGGVQLAFFLVYIVAGGPSWYRHGLALSAAGVFGGLRLWQPITAVWVHLDPRPLLINLLALWLFGPALERWWGRRRFVTFYVLTATAGMGAALLLGLTRWNELVGGSSGASVALLLACGALFRRHLLMMRQILGLEVGTTTLIVGGFALISTAASAAWLDLATQLGGLACAAALLWRGGQLESLGLSRKRRPSRRNLHVVDSPAGKRDRWVN